VGAARASRSKTPHCNFLAGCGHYLSVTAIDAGPPPDCVSARALIDALLLDELDSASDAALRGHLAGCAGCTSELHETTRLVHVLAVLPDPAVSPDLDARLVLAAISDRRRRHEHRSWLEDLPRLVFRGAMRTTGTLVATLISVALLSAALVFAAGNFLAGTALNPTQGATVAPEVTPTLAPTPQQATSVPPPTGTPGPVVVLVTPEPTLAPTPESTATAAPTPEPIITPIPTAEPTLAPTPIPTEKPRRTPPPAPTESPAPSAEVTPSP